LDPYLASYQFPEPHWLHMPTSNPIESIFGSVHLRTNAAGLFCVAILCTTVLLSGRQHVPLAIRPD
jgi:transposase-like protein